MKLLNTLLIALLCFCCLAEAGPGLNNRRLAFRTVAAAAPDNTLLIRLMMDEGIGTAVDDYGTLGEGFTLSGATWITGKSGSGGALSFDGTADYCNSDTTITLGTDVVTACFWIKWDNAMSGAAEIVLELSNPFWSNDDSLVVLINDVSGKITAGIQSGAGFSKYRVEDATTFSSGTWVHFAAVFDNSTIIGDCKIFFDGVEQTTVVRPVATKDQSGNFRTDTLYMGMRGSSTSPFAGDLDDVRIYDSELTTDEITYVMNNPDELSSLPTSNLVGHWAADGECLNTISTIQCTDGEAVNTWTDASAQGNDMTEATNPPTFRADVLGTGLHGVEFDGTADIMHSGIVGLATDQEAMSVYVVAKPDSITGDYAPWSINDASTDVQQAIIYWGSSFADLIAAAARTGGAFNNGFTSAAFDTNTSIATALFTSSTSRQCWINNASAGSANTTSVLMSGLDRMTIGAVGDGTPGLFFDGHIFEVLVYSSVHDAVTRTAIYDYLAAKWGL